MDFSNIWFYTLSTSAQVLAALAGLFAVFAVWKMQDSDKILSEARLAIVQIVSYISGNTEGYEAKRLESLYLMTNSEILEIFSELLSIKKEAPQRVSVSERIRGDNLISYSLDDFTENLYRGHISKKLNILKDLKYILIANFSAIGICILGLTFSNFISCKQIFLPIISLGVLYCLYLIGKGIYVITSE